MLESLNLALPYVSEAQAQKHVTVNDALRRLDTVVQLSIEDRTRSTPPGSPSEGARYIVGASPSGAWRNQAQSVAGYIDGAWTFFDPLPGWLAYVKDENVLVYFDGANWEVLVATGAQQSVGKLGINTAPNTTNRLTVRSRGALFHSDNGAGTGDVQLTVSKAAEGDTASHLFQTDFSSRAEFGLIGSDDFALKVSSDGANFSEAFRVSHTDARVDFAVSPSVAGTQPFGFSVESRAALATVPVPSDITVLDTRGYASEGDGGGGRYVRASTADPTGLGITDAAGGHWALEGNIVTARQAGAVGDGVADDTVALRGALFSGRDLILDEGTYRVTRTLRTIVQSQRIIGAGRGRTVIDVGTDFDMGEFGVIHVDSHHVTVEGLTIDFDQSSASGRASLVQYPPAFYLVDRFRTRLRHIRVRSGFDGIDATGNSGGAIFDDVELGTFNVGVHLGGSLDTVELRNTRVWPYGFAGNPLLNGIYQDGQTIGFRIGQVDDLKMSNCTPFQARVIIEATGPNVPFGTITGLALDGKYSSIEMTAGFISLSSLYATTDVADDSFITLTGGDLVVSDFVFRGSNNQAVPMVSVEGGNLQIQNGKVRLASAQGTGFAVSSGQLAVSSVRFSLLADQNRTAPLIHAIGGSLTAYGNTATQRGTGSGLFLTVDADGDHLIYGNDTNGYDYAFPAIKGRGLYGPNRDGSVVRIDSRTRFGPTDDVNEGGEIVLGGAGTNGDVNLDNNAGNVRIFNLAQGKSLQVLGASGGAFLNGERLTFTSGNALVGAGAGSTLTGDNNVGLGRNTHAASPPTVTNATAIGDGAFVQGSNEVQLGNSATTTYAYGAVQMRSDGRDKTDVRDTVLGLSFLKALRPVDFRWNYREDYERPADIPDDADWTAPAPGSRGRQRYHHGFIAQEVEAVLTEQGVDFGGYQDRTVAGGRDVKSIGYTELVGPLVKAVQELAQKIEALEARS